jgi:hypothetical protein
VLLAKLFCDISKEHGAFIFRVKHLELLDREDEGIMILWNTINYLHTYIVSHLRWVASSAVLL